MFERDTWIQLECFISGFEAGVQIGERFEGRYVWAKYPGGLSESNPRRRDRVSVLMKLVGISRRDQKNNKRK